MLLVAIMKFMAFPERKDSIFQHVSNKEDDILVSSSGSLGLYYGGKCHLTYPNETLHNDQKMDWCSNIAKQEDEKPWISFNLKNKAVKLTGYSVRNGCCYRSCCCTEDNSFVDSDGCCCRLYSFALQGSNDNKTWKTIHKVENDENFYYCAFKTYEFQKTESFSFVRFVQEKEFPGCPFCMQINQMELYGETVGSFVSADNDDNDESVSIIGKLNRDDNE